jgi:hypothetical protein
LSLGVNPQEKLKDTAEQCSEYQEQCTMSFAILRTQKLKAGNIHGSSSHVTRSRETPNADPDRQHLNRTLIGEEMRPVDAILSRVAEITSLRNSAGGKKIRSDAVLAVEYILTASPEHFSGKSQKEIDDWAQHSVKFLQSRHGKNIVSAVLHLDEKTPHLHVYHVPESVDSYNRPTLSAKSFYGSRSLLADIQTNYAKHMQLFNPDLKRGITKSRARHKEIRTWYSEMQNLPSIKIPNLKTGMDVETPPRMITQDSREKWAKQQTGSLHERFIERVKTLKNRLTKALRAGQSWKREFEKEKARSSAYSKLVSDPTEIEKLIKDAQEAKITAIEALKVSHKASEIVSERDYYKTCTQDLEHRVSASERLLKTMCDAVGIKSDEVEEKASSVAKLWKRDVLEKNKNQRLNRS